MDFDTRLYVEIHPFEGPRQPHPHPIRDGGFDPRYLYKVLGVYNPSETSECYFMLANPERQIWFIPQRHLLAHGLIDSDELFLPRPTTKISESNSPMELDFRMRRAVHAPRQDAASIAKSV